MTLKKPRKQAAINRQYRLGILITILLLSFQSFSKNYTLVIEPSYPINQAKKIYEPFRSWLSKESGLDINLIIDKNYYTYWHNAQSNDLNDLPDFTLDAPHIAAYRAEKKNYSLIATTLESLSFHLISLDEPAKDESVQDFMVSKKIIMLPSPSLATIYFKQWFTDLFATPIKDISALSWQESIEIIFDGSAQAAIVPNWIFNLYPNFSTLIESKKIPGATFTASPNLSQEVVDKVQSALLSMKENNSAYNVLVELNTEGFKTPNPDEFTSLSDLLPNR